MREVDLLKTTLQRLRSNLLEIRAQRSVFIDPRNASPDLLEAERRVLQEIDQNERQLEIFVQPVEIKFVVVTMLRDEATALISGEVLQGDERDQFQQILDMFQEQDVKAWLDHYNEQDRNKWRPHACADQAIEEIVRETLVLAQHKLSDIPLRLSFCSNEFFDESNEGLQEGTWQKLNASSFVMIVDAISLFHPYIRQTLSDSQTQNNASIIVISPLDLSAHTTHHALENAVHLRMKRAFARFDYHYDYSCEIGVGNLRAMKRWLVTVLPTTAINIQDPKPLEDNNRDFVGYMVRNGTPERGLNAANYSPR